VTDPPDDIRTPDGETGGQRTSPVSSDRETDRRQYGNGAARAGQSTQKCHADSDPMSEFADCNLCRISSTVFSVITLRLPADGQLWARTLPAQNPTLNCNSRESLDIQGKVGLNSQAMAGKKKSHRIVDGEAARWFAFGSICQALFESIGLPGTFLVMVFYIVVRYASPEQKRDIIDMYVLWRGPHGNLLPVMVWSLAMVAIFVGQRHFYSKRINELGREVDRLGREKSALQEKLSPSPIHHSSERKSA